MFFANLQYFFIVIKSSHTEGCHKILPKWAKKNADDADDADFHR